MPHSKNPSARAKILSPVENDVTLLETNCHQSPINGRHCALSVQLPSDAAIDVRPENLRALSNLDLSTDTNGTPNTASGFMLISVRHLSKARRGKLRAQSVSLPPKCRRPGSESLQYSMFDPSSHEDSSPTSSHSHVGEDEYSNDGLYGSGSIEAEEFEDDELDEEEVTHGGALLVGVSGKHVQKVSPLKIAAHPDAPCSSTTEPEVKRNAFTKHPTDKVSNGRGRLINSLPDASALRATWVPLNERIQQGACSLTFPVGGQNHSSCRRQRPLATHGRHVHLVGSHDLMAKFQPMYGKLLPLIATAHVQTNTSHFESQVLTCTPIPANSVHTAPASGQVSPPQLSEYTIMLEPSSLPEPYTNGHIHPQSLSTHSVNHDSSTLTSHPPILYSHYNGAAHTQHSGPIQQPVACPHHLHTGGATDIPPSSLIDGSNTSGSVLVPNVAAINAASIPNLQPASRFRKARIHETVEQWSHGRASIHDCRLKVVPDWVWELQKKASTLEQDVATAMLQRVNCSSCLENKVQAPDPPAVQQIEAPDVSRQLSFNQVSCSNHPPSNSEHLPSRTVSISRETYRNNLFSFWEGGCRVNTSLPKASCSPLVRHLPSTNKVDQSTGFCPICAGVVVVTDVELPKDIRPENIPTCIDNSVVHLDRSGQCKQINSGESALNVGDGRVPSGPTIDPETSSAFSNTAVLPPKSTDPATAYLIHQQLGLFSGVVVVSPGSDPKYVTSPTTVSALQSPRGQIPESHHLEALSVSSGNGTLKQYNFTSEVGQPSLAHKRDLSLDVSGLAPPTSPALLHPGDVQSNWSDISCPSVTTRGIVNGVAHDGEASIDGPTTQVPIQTQGHEDLLSLCNNEHHPFLRLRDASGRYHNVIQMDPNYVSNDLEGHSRERPWVNMVSGGLSKTATKDLPTGVDVSNNTKIAGKFFSPGYEHHPRRYATSPCSLQSCYPRSRSSTKSVPGKLFRDSRGTGRARPSLSKRLEARISESVDVIRSAIEEAFRDELAAAHSENVALLSEVERLSNEVSALRGYQTAFHALRPFVAPEIWDHLCSQQLQSGQQHPSSTGSGSPIQNGSPEHPS